MTFIVAIWEYEDNLSRNTSGASRKITEYNPDKTWRPVCDD